MTFDYLFDIFNFFLNERQIMLQKTGSHLHIKVIHHRALSLLKIVNFSNHCSALGSVGIRIRNKLQLNCKMHLCFR